MSVTRSIMAGLLIGIAGGCTTIPQSEFMSPYELKVNDELKKERAKVLNLSLEEKIKLVEQDIEKSFVNVGTGVLLPFYINKNNNPGPLHLEHNTILLSALSAKYAVTKDQKTKEEAENLVRGIIELDKLNELDGYIPLMADAKTKIPAPVETHANAYIELLFSYAYYTKNIGKSKDIEMHVSKIYEKFLEDNFELKHTNKVAIVEANLNRSWIDFNPARALDRRVLDEVTFFLGDKNTKDKVMENKWKGIYVSPNNFDLGFWQLPTMSSCWLNIIKMAVLNECGCNYTNEIVSLTQHYSKQKNPFFQTLAYMADDKTDISFVEKRLKEYPYPITDKQMINSHRKEIVFRGKRYIKNQSKKETGEALPLYEIGSDVNLWKRNLLEADKYGSNFGRKFLGVDLLQAYWFYEFAKKRKQVQ